MLLLLLTSLGRAEPAPPEIPLVNMPLAAWVASRSHALPDTLPNFETPAGRTETFRAMLASVAARNWPQAAAQAKLIAYLLVMIREGGSTFVIASDDSGTGRDPTIIINFNSRRDLIIGAPHVAFERGTGEQAIIFLRDLGGRAAIISGAHRCASRTFTVCDGTTEVCGGTSQKYRNSDAGHNIATLYHGAHVLFAGWWPHSIIISLHGMREDTEGVRTSVIISNGIRADDTALQTPATRFRRALDRWISQPGTIVSCNLPADAVFAYRKLCGYTNVQGRHVNGDTDACWTSVDRGTGQFIHMEQDWAVLQPYAQNRAQIGHHPLNNAFLKALTEVLPPVSGL